MANRIRELRRQRAQVAPTAYSVAQLAHRLRVSERALERWERGVHHPTKRHARALARELGVTVEDLRLEQRDSLRPLAAGVIVRNNRVLLTQRRFPGHGEQWSFPSGKIEGGESLEEALVRELHEELLIPPAQTQVGERLGDVDLPSGFRMSVFRAVIAPDAEPQLNDYEQLSAIAWMARDEAEQAFRTLPDDIAKAGLALVDRALSAGPSPTPSRRPDLVAPEPDEA